MAFPAWAAAAVQGGTGIAGGLISGAMNSAENYRTRKWNEDMYWMQEDQEAAKWRAQNDLDMNKYWMQDKRNIELWNMQNEYNSPMAQMARFKQAGLNPNLIYGQMNNGGGISTAQFGHAKPGSGSVGSVPPNRWDIDAGNFMSTFLAAKESGARIDNLMVQNEVLKQDVIQKAAQTVGIETANKEGQIKLDVLGKTAMDAAETAVQLNKAQLNRTEVGTSIDLSRNEREAAQNSMSLREAGERILNMRGQRMNMELDNKLKEMDIHLKQLGIQPTDNMIIRMLARWLQGDTGKTGDEFSNWFLDNWQK